MIEIHFGEALTLDEFSQALKIGARPIMPQSGFSMDIWLLLLLAGSAMVLSGGWAVLALAQQWGVYLFLAGLFMAVIGVRTRKTPQELWKRNESYRARREGVITDDSIEITTPTGFSRLEWADFSGFGEYEDVFVLFLDTSVEAIFSQRFFQSEEDWLQFKDLAAQKLERSHLQRRKFKLN